MLSYPYERVRFLFLSILLILLRFNYSNKLVFKINLFKWNSSQHLSEWSAHYLKPARIWFFELGCRKFKLAARPTELGWKTLNYLISQPQQCWCVKFKLTARPTPTDNNFSLCLLSDFNYCWIVDNNHKKTKICKIFCSNMDPLDN